MNSGPEDVRARLLSRLTQIDCEELIKDIRFAKKDDVMAYLGIRQEYRWTTFASALLMLAGLALLALSLQLETVSHALCVLALCLLVPLTTSIAYH